MTEPGRQETESRQSEVTRGAAEEASGVPLTPTEEDVSRPPDERDGGSR